MRRTLLLLLIAAGLLAATPCPEPRDVPSGARLEDLAVRYFGDSRYAISLALATNSRTADGFRYIVNPDDLTGISRVCIPSKSEARELERSWQAYARAVDAARLPRMSKISNKLLIVPPDQPVKVVAWMRKDQADGLKTASRGWGKQSAIRNLGDPRKPFAGVLPNFCQRTPSGRGEVDEASGATPVASADPTRRHR